MIEIVALRVTDFVHPPTSPLAGQDAVVMAYAVRHPSGVVLFDTGMGMSHPLIDADFRPRSRPIEAALAAVGIGLDEVTAVVNSHLHFDHAGQNPRFTGRPIYAQAVEHQASHAPNYTIAEWVHAPGLHYELLDGEYELAPGIRILPTPGHTVGHQSLVVDDGAQRSLIAGQAVYTRAEWLGANDPALSGEASAHDPERYRASVALLRSLDPDLVLFGHDPEPWRR